MTARPDIAAEEAPRGGHGPADPAVRIGAQAAWIAIALVLALLAALGLWLGFGGGMARLTTWAAEGQREVQNAMAGSLRALKGNQPGALAGLLGLCFAYGFFHAAGPGHGKLLIGGYGLTNGATARRLSLIALLSSLGQAVTAILLVRAGIALLDWSRETMTATAETVFAPASWAAVGLIGLWLVLRAARRVWRSWRAGQRGADGHDHARAHAHDHGHDHGHDHHHHGHAEGACEACGHRHGPTLDEVSALSGLRDAALLIGAIAIRPCTGALFLLIITWRMGLVAQGIAGCFAMALGTASVTVAVALAATLLRRGALERMTGALPGAGARNLVGAVIEVSAGAIIAIVSLSLFLNSI